MLQGDPGPPGIQGPPGQKVNVISKICKVACVGLSFVGCTGAFLLCNV